MSSPVVGIDLGTTNSAVAIHASGRTELLHNELGEVLTPSAVAYDPAARGLVVGRVAKDLIAAHPELGALAFKRDMGQPREYSLGPEKLGPVDLSSYVLDALRADAERVLGQTVTRAVITVPAYFDESQRAATKQAAELIGLTVERMLNEPTAAALCYGLAQAADQSLYLVFDLGGGTFDVSIVEVFERVLEVKAVAGESRLGGEDFTEALADLLLRRAELDPDEARTRDPAAFALLLRRAELLKRKLSRWSEAQVMMPPFGKGSRERELRLSQVEAEACYRPLIQRLARPCLGALRDAGLEPAALSEVVLVGGATRLGCVRDFVRELLGREPRLDSEPDLVVVRGAALQAAMVARDEAVEDVVVTDVASHSLGVEVVREIAGQHLSGYFCPILHRNTVIPCSRVELMQPVHEGQRILELKVYEGEARRVAENRHIGTILVRGLPKKGDRSVSVRFTYDLNGMLEVEAKIEATGQVVTRVFTRDGRSLNEEEMLRLSKRLQRLKASPYQRPRYRDLLGRANLLWQDLDPQRKELLGWRIDQFEAALASQNPALMEEAYRELGEICQQLDDGERH